MQKYMYIYRLLNVRAGYVLYRALVLVSVLFCCSRCNSSMPSYMICSFNSQWSINRRLEVTRACHAPQVPMPDKEAVMRLFGLGRKLSSFVDSLSYHLSNYICHWGTELADCSPETATPWASIFMIDSAIDHIDYVTLCSLYDLWFSAALALCTLA